jgi:hypothetical protein
LPHLFLVLLALLVLQPPLLLWCLLMWDLQSHDQHRLRALHCAMRPQIV